MTRLLGKAQGWWWLVLSVAVLPPAEFETEPPILRTQYGNLKFSNAKEKAPPGRHQPNISTLQPIHFVGSEKADYWTDQVVVVRMGVLSMALYATVLSKESRYLNATRSHRRKNPP